MIKLPPEIKKAWTEALRSGKYQQGHGALRTLTSDGVWRYCCLGVLYEVCGGEWKIEQGSVYGHTKCDSAACPRTEDLPSEVSRVLTQSASPILDMPGQEMDCYFIHLNDGLRLTFPQIAAKIDEHL
jgi:hypothetical protein